MLLLLAAAVSAAVVELTDATFPAFVKENPLTLVEFYAPWCGHCKKLAPEYDQAAEELAKFKVPVKIAKIDCTAQKEPCSLHNVEGFPTLIVFQDGVASPYKAERTAQSIVKTLKKHQLPPVQKLDSIDALLKDEKVSVVLFSKDTAQQDALLKAAKKSDFVFASVSDPLVAEKHAVVPPALVLFKQFDEKKVVYKGKFTEAEISAFVAENSVPLMADIGPDNYEFYVKRGLPIAYLFVESDEQRKELAPVFEPLAKQYRASISFVYIDAAQFGSHASNLALKEDFPAFAVQDEQKKFPFSQDKELTSAAVTEFLANFSSGDMEPVLKSEEIPATNDDDVKVVVGKNFAEIVLDKKNDVLLEFYAPWCGHCKKLAPIYDELASSIAGSPGVVIAKFDGSNNDSPPALKLDVQGFPTIMLFKAGSNEVVTFQGDRTMKSMLAFLQENAVNGKKIVVEAQDDDEEESEEL